MALAREAVVGNYGSSVKINTGVALCHADDEYNKRVGVETAKQKIKPVSFKLKGFRFDNERKNNLTIGEILFYLLPENPPVKRGEIDMLVIKIVDGKYVRLKHVSLKGHLSL